MFERFTERARQVVVLAQQEARSLKHNYIGTEHLLLGLIGEEEGLAARVLDDLGIERVKIRAGLVGLFGVGTVEPEGQIAFTPRAKNVIELSLREALALGHNYIGTEHILLAIAREGEGVASKLLLENDVEGDLVRERVIKLLSGPVMRQFDSGATRDSDAGKLDLEGFLSPLALTSFAEYMHRNRQTATGVRSSDNWQRGIPLDAYMKSLTRHFFELWTLHRAESNGMEYQDHQAELIDALCALFFNVQGYLHEITRPPR